MKFAVKALPAMETKRLCIKTAGHKGKGVFLRAGISLLKGTNVMKYGGRVCVEKPEPMNDYTFQIRYKGYSTFLDASNAADCKTDAEL
jgi:hypothetical protein